MTKCAPVLFSGRRRPYTIYSPQSSALTENGDIRKVLRVSYEDREDIRSTTKIRSFCKIGVDKAWISMGKRDFRMSN